MSTTGFQALKRARIHPGHTRLEDSLLPEPYKKALKQLGYLTVEQVVSAARIAGPRLSKYLSVDIQPILRSLPLALVAPQLSAEVEFAQYKFGALLLQEVQATMPRVDLTAASHIPAPRAGFAVGPSGTPDVNLIPGMQPIRDQGGRGTCVAHASVAAAEYYSGAQGQQQDLSEQFQYWNCKQHDGRPNEEGTFLSVAMPLLVSDGCCRESDWPYNPNQQAGNEGQGPPPPAAVPDAATRKVPHVKQLSPQSVMEIKDELAANRPVPVSVVVYEDCWFPDEIRNSGDVTMPFPGDKSNAGHAICIVGYEDLPGEPELGGGRFIIRNSWDGLWGVNCQFGSGYGTLPYAYLTTYGTEAYSID
ncbi:MAG: C1 family peptidase [Acidobacteriia bacterium]|nr:C1 family peptidase [Terriglobia bacterium]